MPGQNLRLYDITPKVNERTDGKSCSADQLWVASRGPWRDRQAMRSGQRPFTVCEGLAITFELFFDGVEENL